MNNATAPTDRIERMARVKRVVVKIGTTSVAGAANQLNRAAIRRLVVDVVALRERDIEVAIVSSGAVAAGMGRLDLPHRPTAIAELQAVAAVGQNLLMHSYESLFKRFGTPVGQVLLTAEDIFDNRQRYLNLRNTFRQLFSYGVVPVINENDSVGVAELKRTIGENDILAAYVANLVHAELLVMLSDVDGLHAEYTTEGPVGPVIRQVNECYFALCFRRCQETLESIECPFWSRVGGKRAHTAVCFVCSRSSLLMRISTRRLFRR